MFVHPRLPPTPVPAPPARRNAFELLLESHERMRFFTERVLKVARLPDMPVVERGETLARVERYFTVALPLHVEEEDVLLAHRVWAARPSSRALKALEEMSWQHRELEGLLASLLPRWRLLRESPERHAELAGALGRDSTRFAEVMEAHLELEEGVVFPEARASLSSLSVASLGAEMRERRGLKP